jgi:3-deoxy-D-manno-octulosonic-acid transferase
VTASLALYQFGTRLLEPMAPFFFQKRLREGKERPDRIGERFGHATLDRPSGEVIWLHGASVGESSLLLDLFSAAKQRRPGLDAVVTTQTLTSADVIAAGMVRGVRHQMAPIDAPRSVERFLDHWKPDAAVFAEGEIWPNMLGALQSHRVPAALVNARMTTRTLAGWRRRAMAAQEIFSAFDFIGAADAPTAIGLMQALERPIEVVGNLKKAAQKAPPAPAEVAAWREAIGDRPVLLAASTHPGEDEIALDAFTEVRMRQLGALLIIVPRHPERGQAVADLSTSRGFTTQRRALDRSEPKLPVDVLVADTMGELIFWYAASDAIFLGGASVEGIGGHNPIEPAQLGKVVMTGPHGFNFKETFEQLAKAGAVKFGDGSSELSDFWLAELENPSPPPVLTEFFASADEPFKATVEAVLALLRQEPAHA